MSTGLGCDANPTKAAQAAILEAVRDHLSRLSWLFRGKPSRMPSDKTLEGFIAKKSRWWSSPFGFRKIMPLLSGEKVVLQKETKITNHTDLSNKLLDEFAQKDYEVYAVDVKLHQLKLVASSEIPEVHPAPSR